MRSLSLATLIITLLGLSACAVNPVTGKRELSIIPPSQEVAMGAQNYIPMQQQQGGRYVVDPDLGRYVNEVGQRLAALSDRPGLPYEFVVINNNVPNAWALPGGKIAINRGLLVELEDEAQLAAVLGHEVVHVAAKHSVQKMQQAQLIGLGMLAAGVLTKDSDYGAAATLGVGLGASLWSAKYGRDQELQSDEVGMKYMVDAGYDPRAAVELQETFVRLSEQRGQSNWLEGLFASHPPSQERVEKNQSTAAAIGALGTRNATAYRSAIAQIKRDQPAYDRQQQAMATLETGDLDKALSLLDEAIALQPQEALFYAAKGKILLTQKKDSRAAAAFTQAKRLNPDYFMGHLGLGIIEKKQARYDQAKVNLMASQKLLPTQTANFYLGEIALQEGNSKDATTYFKAVAEQGGELGEKAQTYLISMGVMEAPAPQ